MYGTRTSFSAVRNPHAGKRDAARANAVRLFTPAVFSFAAVTGPLLGRMGTSPSRLGCVWCACRQVFYVLRRSLRRDVVETSAMRVIGRLHSQIIPCRQDAARCGEQGPARFAGLDPFLGLSIL